MCVDCEYLIYAFPTLANVPMGCTMIAMSQPPGPYERSYSFTDFSTNNPNAQQPGQKIDQELNNVRTALNDTQDRLEELQADDGKLRESCLRMETLGPAVAPFVSPSAIQAVEAAGATQIGLVNAAGSTQVGLVNDASADGLASINAVLTTNIVTRVLGAEQVSLAAAADAVHSKNSAYSSMNQAYTYYQSVATTASIAQQAAGEAQASADMAVNYQLNAMNATGECQTLVQNAQSAASLAEYWNGLSQDASAAAISAQNASTTAVDTASYWAGMAISSAGDASASAGVAVTAADASATSATNAAASAASSAASAGSITPFTGGAVTSAISLVSGPWHTWFDVGEIYGYNSDDGSFFDAYPNYLAAGDGTNYVTLTTAGVRFADGTIQATAATGGSGSYLPLAGGTMTGNITFDGTSGQFIGKGQFDTSRGGNYGISLVCSIGYEFNWQAGWLTTTNQGSPAPRPLYLDSLAGTTLRVWNSSTDTGTEVTHNGIVMNGGAVIDMAASTTDSEVGGWGFGVELTGVPAEQSTVEYNQIRTKNAEYSFTATPTQVRVFEDTNSLGVTIAHDSIAIQHIDTPNQTAYMTNEYIGFEDMGGTPHSTYIEHDVITVQNDVANTAVRANSLTVTEGDANSQLNSGSLTFNSIGVSGYIGASDWGIDNIDGRSLHLGPNYLRLESPGIDPGLARPQVSLTTSALTFLLEDEVPAATYAATGVTVTGIGTYSNGVTVTNDTYNTSISPDGIYFGNGNYISQDENQIALNSSPNIHLNGGTFDATSGTSTLSIDGASVSVNAAGSNATILNATGITFPDSSTQATAAATNNSQLATNVTGQNSSFTVTAAYANVIVRVQGSATVSLDDDSNNPFPYGAQVVFINESGSTITFQSLNSAQIFSADSLVSITKNYGTAVAIKLNSYQWSLSGNLA